MSTIVQEDKIKFQSHISLCQTNSQFMVFVLANQPKTLRIRHLYDQSYADLSTIYSHSIVSVNLNDSNHIVVLDEINQVDIVYLESTQELKIINIKGFQKKQLKNIIINDSHVAMLTEGKLHILELKQNICLSNNKYEIEGIPIEGSFSQNSLYIYCDNNIITKWTKNQVGKFEQSSKITDLKYELLQIKAFRNMQTDYLVCLSKQNQVTVLSSEGRVVDILKYQGVFQHMEVNHNLVTIVSNINESSIFSMYFCEKNYDPKSSRMLFNKYQTYIRNAKFNDIKILLISKKDWTTYSRRKGSKEVVHLLDPDQQTFCLVYGKLQNDFSKLQLLKIDLAKVLNKDRGLEQLSVHPHIHQPDILRNEKKQIISEKNIKQSSKNQVSKQVHKQPLIRRVQFNEDFFKGFSKIMDERISPLVDKITKIEQKISHLQSKMNSINSQGQLQKIFSAKIQKQVVSMFESKLVPKLQEYFEQIFSDLAQVFNQGIEYYNQKLIIQSNIHKQTFKELVLHTLNATKDIVSTVKLDLPHTLKIDQLLNECVSKKQQLLRKTQQLLKKVQKSQLLSNSNLQKQVKGGKQGNQKQSERRMKEQEKDKDRDKQKKARKNFVKSNLQ